MLLGVQVVVVPVPNCGLTTLADQLRQVLVDHEVVCEVLNRLVSVCRVRSDGEIVRFSETLENVEDP